MFLNPCSIHTLDWAMFYLHQRRIEATSCLEHLHVVNYRFVAAVREVGEGKNEFYGKGGGQTSKRAAS